MGVLNRFSLRGLVDVCHHDLSFLVPTERRDASQSGNLRNRILNGCIVHQLASRLEAVKMRRKQKQCREILRLKFCLTAEAFGVDTVVALKCAFTSKFTKNLFALFLILRVNLF